VLGTANSGSPSNAGVRLRRTCRLFCAIAALPSTLRSDLLRPATHYQPSAAHRQEQILDHGGGRDVHAFDECLHRIA
jgi:hypothetical protein